MSVLFRKDIPPYCVYCQRATPLNRGYMSCRKYGVVEKIYHCKSFEYDPLKRIPTKPVKLKKTLDSKSLSI